MCRVFRKEALILDRNLFEAIPDDQNNKLSDLSEIVQLDFSSNRIEKIPDNIGLLLQLIVSAMHLFRVLKSSVLIIHLSRNSN